GDGDPEEPEPRGRDHRHGHPLAAPRRHRATPHRHAGRPRRDLRQPRRLIVGMFAHWLLTFWRSVARHRLYAAINVLGLALGVAVFLVLMLVVRFQTSFEQWIPHADQIYVIRTKDVLGTWYPGVFGG